MSNFRVGDWMCQSCGTHNFASKAQCRQCGAPAPAGAGPAAGGGNVQAAMDQVFGCGGGGGGMAGGCNQMKSGNQFKPGDWFCQSCGTHNFAKNPACRKCGSPAPAGDGQAGAMGDMGGGMMMGGGSMGGGGMGGGGMGGGGGHVTTVKPGDWFCQSCGTHNFASKVQCRKCGAPAPAGAGQGAAGQQAGMGGMMGCGGGMMGGNMTAMMGGQGSNFKLGDWICQACGNHNWARNEMCKKCGNPRPEGAGPQAGQMRQRSRSPRQMQGMMWGMGS